MRTVMEASLHQYASRARIDRRHALVAVDTERLPMRILLHLEEQLRLAEQGPTDLHEREPLVECPCHRVEPVDPAEQDERHRRSDRGAELTGVRKEIRLLERVLLEEPAAEQLHP